MEPERKQQSNTLIENQRGWALVPAPILSAEDLTPAQKLLWGRIHSLIGPQGYCSETNSEIAGPLNLNESTISKYITELTTKKYLVREINRNGSGTERHLFPAMGGRIIFLGGADYNDTPPSCIQGNTSIQGTLDTKVNKVYQSWLSLREKNKLRGPKPQLTVRRKSLIKARLGEGFTCEDIDHVMQGCFGNEYNLAKGFTDIELICRENKIRQYISWYDARIRDKRRTESEFVGPEPLKSLLKEYTK